jgi:hypothetical protein
MLKTLTEHRIRRLASFISRSEGVAEMVAYYPDLSCSQAKSRSDFQRSSVPQPGGFDCDQSSDARQPQHASELVIANATGPKSYEPSHDSRTPRIEVGSCSDADSHDVSPSQLNCGQSTKSNIRPSMMHSAKHDAFANA